MKTVRLNWGVGLTGLLLVALALIWCWPLIFHSSREVQASEKPIAKQVTIAHPRPAPTSQELRLPGRVDATRKADLFFRVSGPLVEVNIAPGDHVHKGQVLMRIDSRDYEHKVALIESQIQSSEARLLKMKTGARVEDIRILEQSIQEAQARLQMAKSTYDRFSKLRADNAVAQQEFDQTRTNYLTAQAQVVSLKYQLSREKSGARREDIMAAEAELVSLKTQLKVAQDQLADTRLVAPFDGTITKQLLENHEMAQAGQQVLSVHDISFVELAVDVPENQIAYFLGQAKPPAFHVQFLTLSQKRYPADLQEWNGQADSSTGTYRVVFRIEQSQDQLILPGMTAELIAEFPENLSSENPLLIPMQSVVNMDKGRGSVWLVNPETRTAALRPVVLGDFFSEEGVLVREGLTSESWIVVEGAPFVQAGEPLELMTR